MCLPSLVLQRHLLIRIYSLIANKYFDSFLWPPQSSSMQHWKFLVVAQQNRLNHAAEANGFTMSAADSGEGSMGRDDTYRQKIQRDSFPEKPLVGPTQIGNSCCSSVAGVHLGHVVISSNSSILWVHDLVVSSLNIKS